ncbi:MAG: hypothetical protein Q7T82_02910 [Armatimonadota bacterium]|nr:hypothetical protein [Armatimonadota bacterium]
MTEIDDEVIQPRAAMMRVETAVNACCVAARFQTDADRLRSMRRQELRKIAETAQSADTKLAQVAPVA